MRGLQAPLSSKKDTGRFKKCTYYQRTAMCARETSSELSLPRVGLKECFCLACSFVRAVASSATSAVTCQRFNDGRSFQTRGDNLHRKYRRSFIRPTIHRKSVG